MTIRYYATTLLFLVSVLSLPVSARAQATFTVTSNLDGDLGTLAGNSTCELREAVAAANTDSAVDACTPDITPGNDTILFDPSLADATITLTEVGETSDGFSALEIITTITIDGVDAPGLTITQNIPTTGGRLFYVDNDGDGDFGDLTLRNLTLEGGLAQGFDGGDAFNGGAGGGSAGLGGAVFVSDANLTIEQCTFTGNTAQGGNGGDTMVPSDLEQGGGAGGAGLLGDGASPTGFGGADGGPNEGGHGGNAGSEAPAEEGRDGFLGGGGGGGGSGATEGLFGFGGFGGFGGLGGGGGGGGTDFISFGKVSAPGGNGGFGGGAGGFGVLEDETGPAGGAGGGGGGFGGAIFLDEGFLTIRNSTFTNNTAQGGLAGTAGLPGAEAEDGSGLGGAVFAYNTITEVRHATFDVNTADEGGGFYAVGDFIIEESVAAKSQGVDDSFAQLFNSIFSNSMLPGGGAATDFVSTTENAGTETANGSGNLMESQTGYDGTNASTDDPQLEALADNGGPTQTQALMSSSPAIDTADPAETGGLNTDQRGMGFARVEDGDSDETPEPDIGAFEFVIETGTITIEKSALPQSDTDFAFTGDLGPFTLDDAEPDDGDSVENSITFAELTPGTYTVTEVVPDGWDLAFINCGADQNNTAAVDGVNIVLEAGEEVTCTFFNQEVGSITIVKDADPADGTDFSFTFEEGVPEKGATQPSFLLDDAVPDDDDGVESSMTFDDLEASEYSITEFVPEGWELDDIDCTNEEGSEFFFEGSSVFIALGPGDAVVCTFTNIRRGSLTIIKDAEPADGTDFEFTHTIFDDRKAIASAPAGGLPTFILDDADPDDDDNYTDRITFEEVRPGTYDILEEIPEEWSLIDIDCGSAPTEPLTDGVSVTVGSGEDIVCTFTNSNVDIDLGITKEVNNPTPDYGSDVVFTLVASNLGNVSVSDVVVDDVLPYGLVFVSASSGYNEQTGRWVIGTMPAGGETTLTITARVETLSATTNTATISSRSVDDPMPENNTDSATVTPIAADLELTKERVSVAFHPEDGTYTVGFVIKVVNNGPSDATNVAVTDFGEEGLTFVAATPSQGTYYPDFAPQTGLWEVGTLLNGASATLNVTIIIDEDDNEDSGLINVAEVTASDQVDPDSVPADGQGDDFSGDVGLRGPIRGNHLITDLALTKTVDNPTPVAGEQVVYTLTVLNESDIATQGVQVKDLLPAGLSFVSATTSDPDDTYDPVTGLWDVGSIVGGASTTLMITVTVSGSDQIVNTAEITRNNLPDSDSETNNGRLEDDRASATIAVKVAKGTDTDAESGVPTAFVLGQNYPNPFNPQTTIPYAVPEAAHVTIAIYDLLGRELIMLVDGQMGIGRYEVTWDAHNRPTGLYLVRLQAGSMVKTRRITLMK